MFILKTNIRDQVPFKRVSFYIDFEETSLCFFEKEKAFTGKETEQVKLSNRKQRKTKAKVVKSESNFNII